MSQVNVIDSIVITKETNLSIILAEWSALDPEISGTLEFESAQATKLNLNWSDQNGTIDLQTGDYFTFVVPGVFRQDTLTNVTDAAIKTPLGEIIATYSIYDNSENMKEVKLTFTDFVETHSGISGSLWLRLFVGNVKEEEEKTLEFVVNGELAASGEVTITPTAGGVPHNSKAGHSALGDIYNGYYIFNWVIRLNMEEDTVNGFHKVENFSFEDVIPEDSPHVFLTDEIRQELGLAPSKFPLRVGEYMSADSYPPEERYPFFLYQYNATGSDFYYFVYAPLVNGYTTVGIDGADGLNVSDVVVSEKSLSAKLGTLTRPTGIQYCTIATTKIAERALGDEEVCKLFTNTFKASYGKDMTSSLIVHRFDSGGQGLVGTCSFAFTKVDENGNTLSGVRFSLFTSESSELADRFVYSDDNGLVSFINLPEDVYYIRETTTPQGYSPNKTVYKVVLSSTGFEIFYGDNYEKKLSDDENKIINILEHDVEPVSVILEGTKRLTGQTMSDGMFSFTVKDSGGNTVAAGTNTADGRITFSEIEFDTPGTYTYTIAEVSGSIGGITYDDSYFTVSITVQDGGNGKLTAQITYPEQGVVFNNRAYADEPVVVILTGTKTLAGKQLTGGMFSFFVTDSTGAIVANATNAPDGSITFSELKYDAVGVYTLKMAEKADGQSGIIFDNTIYTVTVTVKDEGGGKLTAEILYPAEGIVFRNAFSEIYKTCRCYARKTKCRKSIEGKKIWIDNNNAEGLRPPFTEINLIRDDKVYKSINVDSKGDGAFIFCCVPIMKNPRHRYVYRIDEVNVPSRYTKKVEGNNVINTLTDETIL